MRAVLLACLLGACASAGREELPPPALPQRAGIDPVVAARAEGVAFRGVGDDFVLNIYRRERITLAWGDQDFAFPRVEPTLPAWNGEVYETSDGRYDLRIEIRRVPCAIQGETLPARVQLTLDGATLLGCGRDY
ncbi:MAG: hypothetical protein AB7Q23_05780 [Hyphomonadaceae bacterium]